MPDHSYTIKGGRPSVVASATNTSTHNAEEPELELDLDLEQLDLEPEIDTDTDSELLCLPLPQLFVSAWKSITSCLGKSKPIPCPGLHLLDLPYHYKPLQRPTFASPDRPRDGRPSYILQTHICLCTPGTTAKLQFRLRSI